MALSETYVDPSIAGNSGTGTSGDPYGDLQYALDTMTRDSTNGDRINIKAGTDEVLTGTLSVATYGTPTADAPLVLQGYTSAAEDGGIGAIDGNSNTIISTAWVYVRDMELHSSGSNALATNLNGAINCTFHNSSFTSASVAFNTGNLIINCYFYDLAGWINPAFYSAIYNCYFKNGPTNSFTRAINTVTGTVICNNVIDISGSTDAIAVQADYAKIINNTIYSTSGTGNGIDIASSSYEEIIIVNNYIEGFSGTGGNGIESTSGSSITLLQSNRYYNNSTNESISGSVLFSADNSAVGSSSLTDPSNGDFTVNTDLKAAGWPSSFNGASTNQYIDIGAAQRQEAGAAGGDTLAVNVYE